MKSGLFLLFVLSHNYELFAQKTLVVSFTPTIENQAITLNSSYNLDTISLQLTSLKYFISDFSIFYKDKLVAKSKEKHQLIDFKSSENRQFPVYLNKNVPFDKVTFKIGVDSATSISGVFEGDLDPSNGMYWTWQSGYINFKLEGVSPDCPTRQNKFQLHIGGYQSPFNMLREVNLPINNKVKNEIKIELNLDSLLIYMFKNKVFNMMSPSQKALSAADFFPKIFRIKK